MHHALTTCPLACCGAARPWGASTKPAWCLRPPRSCADSLSPSTDQGRLVRRSSTIQITGSTAQERLAGGTGLRLGAARQPAAAKGASSSPQLCETQQAPAPASGAAHPPARRANVPRLQGRQAGGAGLGRGHAQRAAHLAALLRAHRPGQGQDSLPAGAQGRGRVAGTRHGACHQPTCMSHESRHRQGPGSCCTCHLPKASILQSLWICLSTATVSEQVLRSSLLVTASGPDYIEMLCAALCMHLKDCAWKAAGHAGKLCRRDAYGQPPGAAARD